MDMNINLSKGLDKFLVFFVALTILLSFPSNLLRLSGVEAFSGSYTNGVFVGFIMFSIVNILIGSTEKFRLTALPFVLVFFLLYILVLGVAKGYAEPFWHLRFYILPLFVFFLIIGKHFPLYFYQSGIFWIAIVISHGFGLAYYYVALAGSVYSGIGVQSIAYAAIFFFIQGNKILFSIASLFVILEGKRSILLSLLITITFLRLYRFNAGSKFAYGLILSVSIGLLLTLLLQYLAGFEGSTIVKRINLVNPFSSHYDVFLGSSGRFGEFLSAFNDFNLFDYFFGVGSGYTYEWVLGYASEQSGEIKGYLHMSLANYLLAGGFLGVCVFFYLCKLPFSAIKMPVPLSTKSVAFGFGLFSIIQSFFGFNFAVDAITLIFIMAPAVMHFSNAKRNFYTVTKSVDRKMNLKTRSY